MILKIPEIPGVPFRPQGPPENREQRRRSQRIGKTRTRGRRGSLFNPMLADAREAFERGELSLALADVDRFLGQNPRNTEGAELKKPFSTSKER